MNKVELVNRVVEKSGLKKKDVEITVNALLDSISEALATGERVQLIGFGTFETRTRKARSGRNPQTGASIAIPESSVPAFKPGNRLRDVTR